MANYTPESESIVYCAFQAGVGRHAFIAVGEDSYQRYGGQKNSGVWQKYGKPQTLQGVSDFFYDTQDDYPDAKQLQEFEGQPLRAVFAQKKIATKGR